MDFMKQLQQLEDKFYGEWEEDRASLIPELNKIYK